MHAPQIIFIAINALGVGISLAKNDGRDLLATVIGAAINVGLVYWGGFFG